MPIHEKRIDNIYDKYFSNDTSFTEKPSSFLFIKNEIKYNQVEVRDIWKKGIKMGIEVGLNETSIEGQLLEFNQNCINNSLENLEFYSKFIELCNEYNCYITYHPVNGMIIVKNNNLEIK